MDISGLMNTYTNQIANAAKESSSSGLSNLDADSLKQSTDDELMSVCKEFEAYFLEQVFKSMKKTVPQTQEFSSSSQQMIDYYEEGLIQEYAKNSTEQGSMGLAQMLYEQMKRNFSE